jgi:hypothetical protein
MKTTQIEVSTFSGYDVRALGASIGNAIVTQGIHEAKAVQGKATLKDTILDSIMELRKYHVSQQSEQHGMYIAGCVALFGEGVFNSKGYVSGSVRQAVESSLQARKSAHKAAFMKSRGVTAKKPATVEDLSVYTEAVKVVDAEADKVISGLKSALMRARMIYKAAWANPAIVADNSGAYRGLNVIYSDAAELVKNGEITTKQPAQADTTKGADVPSGKAANNKEAFEMLLASESPATVISWMLELLSLEPAYLKKHSLQLKTLEALKAQL